MFVNTNPFCNKSVISAAKNGNCYSLNGRWIPGILTNVRTLGKRLERINNRTKRQNNKIKISENFQINKLIYKKNKGLYLRKKQMLLKIQTKYLGLKKYYKIFPFILFCLTPKSSFWSLKEATLLNMYSIGLVNADDTPSTFTFSLNVDTGTFATIPFFAALYAKTIKLGNLKRQLKINIKRYRKRKRSKRRRIKRKFIHLNLKKIKLKAVTQTMFFFKKYKKNPKNAKYVNILLKKFLKKTQKYNGIYKNKRYFL